MLRTISRNRSLSRRRRISQNTVTEHLESRTLLTGTVKVAWVAGDIVIRGDARDNAIQIDLSQEEPQDIFTGLDGTRVRFDGQLRRADDLSDLRRLDDIRFDMRLGDDTVIVLSDDFVTPDDVKVDLGFGEDTFVMVGNEQDPTFVNGDLSIRSRGKETTIGLANVEIRGDLKIKTGKEQDAIVLSDVSVGDDTTVATRRSSDIIMAIDSVFGSTTRVRMGSGSDVLMAINSEVDGTLYARGSSGNDTALIDGGSTTGRIRRSGIERLATNLNQLPDSLLNSIDGRLGDLADQANDLLPQSLSNVITNEIDDIRNDLNTGTNPPATGAFVDGQRFEEANFPNDDFLTVTVGGTDIGFADTGFNGSIAVAGNTTSPDSSDATQFELRSESTITVDLSNGLAEPFQLLNANGTRIAPDNAASTLTTFVYEDLPVGTYFFNYQQSGEYEFTATFSTAVSGGDDVPVSERRSNSDDRNVNDLSEAGAPLDLGTLNRGTEQTVWGFVSAGTDNVDELLFNIPQGANVQFDIQSIATVPPVRDGLEGQFMRLNYSVEGPNGTELSDFTANVPDSNTVALSAGSYRLSLRSGNAIQNFNRSYNIVITIK